MKLSFFILLYYQIKFKMMFLYFMYSSHRDPYHSRLYPHLQVNHSFYCSTYFVFFTTQNFLLCPKIFLYSCRASQIVRHIVDICIFQWYPVPQQSRFTQRKLLHNFVVRSAASPNCFAAIHPRQNLLVLRSLFLFERLAAGQPVCNSSYVP